MHQHELGIATLSALFANANRGKDSQPSKPSDFFYFETQGRVHIPGHACDAFSELAKQEILPDWAIAIAPVDDLSKGKSGKPAGKPRAWMGGGVILIAPRIRGEWVDCPVALVAEEGEVLLSDVDTGEQYSVEVPEEGGDRWVLDGCFRILNREF